MLDIYHLNVFPILLSTDQQGENYNASKSLDTREGEIFRDIILNFSVIF